jgi:histidinol-phosphate aminotransferase
VNKAFWSRRIAAVEPYVPGEQPKDRRYVKLNTNENPYPPSPQVEKALREADITALRLYPDPDCLSLRQALAQTYGLAPAQVFVGNGSDEVLAFCYLAFMDEDTPAVFPDITYSFYPVYGAFFGNHCRIVPVKEDFSIPLEDMMQDDGTILLTNPNAPTGMGLPLADVEKLLQANPNHVVIVDEAYVDFGCQSATTLVDRYENLLVVGTFSKSRSLAGMRIGFAFGNENLIAALNTVKNSINSYTLDRMALVAAQAALEDRAYFDDTCKAIAKTREIATGKLKALGFSVLPSQANFVFASHDRVHASVLFRELRSRGGPGAVFPQAPH